MKDESAHAALPFIIEAGAWYRHAEVIVQQRLNNFLVVATILLAAIGTVLAATPPEASKEVTYIVLSKHRANFVLALSLIGLTMSLCYVVLGARQKKFVRLHKEVVMQLAKGIESHEFQFLKEFTLLQDGKEITLPHSQVKTMLGPLQVFGTSSLLVFAPGAFAILFLFLALLVLANAA